MRSGSTRTIPTRASNVLRDFQKLFPGSDVDPVEVHIYRRGHPLYVSAPGTFTRVQPVSRRPMERIVFANTDSEGPLSLTDRGNRGSSPCGSPSGADPGPRPERRRAKPRLEGPIRDGTLNWRS